MNVKRKPQGDVRFIDCSNGSIDGTLPQLPMLLMMRICKRFRIMRRSRISWMKMSGNCKDYEIKVGDNFDMK